MHATRASAPRWGLIGLLTLPLLACAPETPEDRVRALIERARSAAEHRNGGAIYALLCDDFRDQAERTADDLLHAINTYLLTHRNVFALVRVVGIETWGQGDGRAELYAALAGQALDPAASLEGVHADILHLDLTLTNDTRGGLCAKGAHWGPATARDLLLGGRLDAQP